MKAMIHRRYHHREHKGYREGRARTRLYRDSRWLKKNPQRPGEPAPWVLDVTFGGAGDDALETEFAIERGK